MIFKEEPFSYEKNWRQKSAFLPAAHPHFGGNDGRVKKEEVILLAVRFMLMSLLDAFIALHCIAFCIGQVLLHYDVLHHKKSGMCGHPRCGGTVHMAFRAMV
jgi:hypothetical protein